MNARSRARVDRRPVHEWGIVGWLSFIIRRWRVPVCECRARIVTSSGKELMRV